VPQDAPQSRVGFVLRRWISMSTRWNREQCCALLEQRAEGEWVPFISASSDKDRIYEVDFGF
jgi:hypothetical protein